MNISITSHVYLFLYKKGGVFFFVLFCFCFFFPALNSQPVVKEITGSEEDFIKIMQYFLPGLGFE